MLIFLETVNQLKGLIVLIFLLILNFCSYLSLLYWVFPGKRKLGYNNENDQTSVDYPESISSLQKERVDSEIPPL